MTTMFDLPLVGARLWVRRPRRGDVDALVARRNDPDSARFQSWAVPYDRADAKRLIAGAAETDGPTPGEWWMGTITDPNGDEIYGDVSVHLDDTASAAEIGYTLAPAHRGRGLASEAAGITVDALWAAVPSLRRIQARMHPDNLASARVVEGLGFQYEGRTRLSFYRYDRATRGVEEVSDDLIYGLTADDRQTWLNRPTGSPERVELVEITADNQRDIGRLAVHRSQDRLVAPVLRSMADAQFPAVIDGHPVVPWMRAVLADGEPAGFVMMAAPSKAHAEPYLWRFLIDRSQQRRGIGRQVLAALMDQCRSWGHDSMRVSWIPGLGSPEGFYRGLGFEPTGVVKHGEVEARLRF